MLMYILSAQLLPVLFAQQISNDQTVNPSNQVIVNHDNIHVPPNQVIVNHDNIHVPTNQVIVNHDNIHVPTNQVIVNHDNIHVPPNQVIVNHDNIHVPTNQVIVNHDNIHVPTNQVIVNHDNIHVPTNQVIVNHDNIHVPPNQVIVNHDNIHVPPNQVIVNHDNIHVPPNQVIVNHDNIHVPTNQVIVNHDNIHVPPNQVIVNHDNIHVPPNQVIVNHDNIHVPPNQVIVNHDNIHVPPNQQVTNGNILQQGTTDVNLINQRTIQPNLLGTNANIFQQVPIVALPVNNIPLSHQSTNVNILGQILFPVLNQNIQQQQQQQQQGNNLFLQQQPINPTGNSAVTNQIFPARQTSLMISPNTVFPVQNILQSNQLPGTSSSPALPSATGQILPASPGVIQFIDPVTRQLVPNIGNSLESESVNSDIKNKIESGIVNIVDLNNALNLGINMPNNLIPGILTDVNFHNTLHPVIPDPVIPNQSIDSNNNRMPHNIPAVIGSNFLETNQLNAEIPEQQVNTASPGNLQTTLSSNTFPNFPMLPIGNINAPLTLQANISNEPVFINTGNPNLPVGSLHNSFVDNGNPVVLNAIRSTGPQIVQQPPSSPVFTTGISSANIFPPLAFQQGRSNTQSNIPPVLPHLPNFPSIAKQNTAVVPEELNKDMGHNKNIQRPTDVNEKSLNVLSNIPNFPTFSKGISKSSVADTSVNLDEESIKPKHHKVNPNSPSLPYKDQGNPFHNLPSFPVRSEPDTLDAIQHQDLNTAITNGQNNIRNVDILHPVNAEKEESNKGRIKTVENGSLKSQMDNPKLNSSKQKHLINSFVQSIVKKSNKQRKGFQHVKGLSQTDQRNNAEIVDWNIDLSNRQMIFDGPHRAMVNIADRWDNEIENFKNNRESLKHNPQKDSIPKLRGRTRTAQLERNGVKKQMNSNTSKKLHQQHRSNKKHQARQRVIPRKSNGLKHPNGNNQCNPSPKHLLGLHQKAKTIVKNNPNREASVKQSSSLQNRDRVPNMRSFPRDIEPLVKPPKHLHSIHRELAKRKGFISKDVTKHQSQVTQPNFGRRAKYSGTKEEKYGKTSPLRSYRMQVTKNKQKSMEVKYGPTMTLRSRMRHTVLNHHRQTVNKEHDKKILRNQQHYNQERSHYHNEHNFNYRSQSRTTHRENNRKNSSGPYRSRKSKIGISSIDIKDGFYMNKIN